MVHSRQRVNIDAEEYGGDTTSEAQRLPLALRVRRARGRPGCHPCHRRQAA